MAGRPIWRGHLRLALVTCPVSLYTAQRASGDLHFHFINPKTGNRVRMVTLDAETNEEVSRRDLIRGYEFEKDRYVLLEQKDFESAKVETSTTMTIDKFVSRDAISPIYFDTSYYLVPEGEVGQDVYAVLREAITHTGRAALSRVVISRRERAVAIFSLENGMVLHTLHEPRDLYDYHELFERISRPKPDTEMIQLATQLIDRQGAQFEPADLEDRYETRLRDVIEAKLKGEGIAPQEPQTSRGDNVIDLMAALKRSLGRGGPESDQRATAARRKRTPQKTKASGKRTHTRKRA